MERVFKVTITVILAPGNPRKWQWETPQATTCVETQARSTLRCSRQGDLPVLWKPGVSKLCQCPAPGDQLGACRGQYSCAQPCHQLDSISLSCCCCLRLGEDRMQYQMRLGSSHSKDTSEAERQKTQTSM